MSVWSVNTSCNNDAMKSFDRSNSSPAAYRTNVEQTSINNNKAIDDELPSIYFKPGPAASNDDDSVVFDRQALWTPPKSINRFDNHFSGMNPMQTELLNECFGKLPTASRCHVHSISFKLRIEKNSPTTI